MNPTDPVMNTATLNEFLRVTGDQMRFGVRGKTHELADDVEEQINLRRPLRSAITDELPS